MTIALRSVADSGATPTPAGTVPVPAGVVNGDVLVAVVSRGGGTFPTTPAGWTTWATVSGRFAQVNMLLAYRVASSEPATYNFTVCNLGGKIAAYIGVDNTSPANAVTVDGNGFPPPTSSPDITTSVANCLVGRAYSWSFSAVPVCTGYTIEDYESGLVLADNSGPPTTTTIPMAWTIGAVRIGPGGTTTTYVQASSSAGAQGAALWTPHASSSPALYPVAASFALTPA